MSTENTITTAEKDFAAAPNATLDELVGTTTNTALLPEPDAPPAFVQYGCVHT